MVTPKQKFLGISFLCIYNGRGYCVSLQKYYRSNLNFFYFCPSSTVLMVNCLVFLLKIPNCIPDLLYINAIDLTLNGFCQNRGQGFSMGGKPKPCKLVSSMYLAHIVTQTMCYLYTLFKKEMGLFKIF